MAKILFSMDSNCHRGCLIQRQITKNWGVFKWRNGWRLKDT